MTFTDLTVADEYDVVVIGAGPAGITAAKRLARYGKKTLLVEASDHVGGLACSVEVLGSKVDLGPHRFFSSDRRVNEEWLDAVGDDYVMVERVTRIFYDNKFFDYPLRAFNVLRTLGLKESVHSAVSFAHTQLFPPAHTDTFEGWVQSRFGRRLYEIFFKTYSERLWGIPCNRLDADFAAQRIKSFSFTEAIRSMLSTRRGSQHKTLVDRFAYPRGGAGEVYEAMAKQFADAGGDILLNQRVNRVVQEPNTGSVTGVELESGVKVKARHVVSTMPLTLLVKGIESRSRKVDEACDRLRFRNTTLVYLRVSSRDVFPDQWLYMHDSRIEMGRLTNFSNWSPDVGDPTTGTTLCAEYWSNDEDAFWGLSDDELITLAKSDIENTHLVPAADVRAASGAVIRIRRCYPVYGSGYREHLAVIQEFIDGISGLTAIGRYGAFKYNNQDHSILMGLLVADQIVSGEDQALWSVNTDYDNYQEEARIDDTGLVAIAR